MSAAASAWRRRSASPRRSCARTSSPPRKQKPRLAARPSSYAIESFLRMREVRDVIRPRYRNDFHFDHLQFWVQLLTVTRHDRLRPLFVGFVHALFDPLLTVVNPHWGVLSTARSESPRLL